VKQNDMQNLVHISTKLEFKNGTQNKHKN